MVAYQRPQHTPNVLGEVCDGLVRLKKVNLGTNLDPQLVFIATNLQLEEEASLVTLLTEFKDVFAWTYTDRRGVLVVVIHSIPLLA